jgi:BlaI family penicillinase repressor
MNPAPIELTEAEWSIIKAVWDKEPCTAPDIQEHLHPTTGWAYSTVRTLMDRMVTKALLKAEKLRNLTIYRSAVTREQARRGALQYALHHAFDGALAPMIQCLIETRDLTPEELADLEALVRSKRREASK